MRTRSLNIHIYVGGQAGSGAEGHDIGLANVYRPDVNNAFPGDRNYHSFDRTINTGRTGSQQVCAYAINAGPGNHVLLGCHNITVRSDAVRWALAHEGQYYGTPTEQPVGDHRWSGYCWTFVVRAFGGIVPSQEPAQVAFDSYNAKGLVRTDRVAPAGSIVFWAYGTEGHAAVSIGDGVTIGTFGAASELKPTARAGNLDHGGLRYLGWVMP